MYKYIITAALAVALGSSAAQAQTQPDSTTLDLGRFQINKKLAQTVTIKGKDLEQMAFTNLADAINVWLNGAYTNSSSLVYVVDGLTIKDVNAYHINDIEEITLVQNALGHVNGLNNGQQLVLITTKRRKHTGIEASGQANWVRPMSERNNIGFQNGDKQNSIYHNYYLSAFTGSDKLQAGISANYQRDVVPTVQSTNFRANELYRINRFRFNGYVSSRLGESSVIDFTAGYAPQNNKANITTLGQDNVLQQTSNMDEHLFNTQLKLSSHVGSQFSNVFKAGYSNYNFDNNPTITVFSTLGGGSQSTYINNNSDSSHTFNIVDQLKYTAQLNNWKIEPQVNFTYNYITYGITSFTQNSYNSTYVSSSGSTYGNKYKQYLLTPMASISYKNAFNIEGGFLYDIHHALTTVSGQKEKKIFPFVSAALDVIQLLDPSANQAYSVKLYSSYALSNNYYRYSVQLSNFFSNPLIGNTLGQNFIYSHYNYSKSLSAGAELGFLNNSLTLAYNFQRLKYVDPITISPPYYTNSAPFTVYPYTYTNIHRIGLNYKILNASHVQFNSGLNASLIKSRIDVDPGYQVITSSKAWTGGWVNRLTYNHFIAGVDVLYILGSPDLYVNTTSISDKKNAVRVQNLYAGYRLSPAFAKQLQVYVNVRNLNDDKNSLFIDNRRYVGLGFSAGF
ncbi:hypothetical protein GCM10027037_18370 [Mucilaginibacter koreensis]